MCSILNKLLFVLAVNVKFVQNGFQVHFLELTAENLRFASYYGSHMVLQKAPARAVVWGYGETGAEVVLSLSGSHNVYANSAHVVNGKVSNARANHMIVT